MQKPIVLVLVVVFCAAAWAGTTYVVGGNVEKRYFAMLEESGHWGPAALSSRNYQRGFFGSKAETVLNVEIPKADQEEPPASVQLVFAHVFRHGPVPFGSTPALAVIETRLVEFSVDGERSEAFLEKFPELKQSTITTRVAFNGTTGSQLQVPAFERQVDDVEIKWEGLRFDCEFAPGKKTLVGAMDAPGMEIRSDANNITLGGIRGQFDLNEVLPQLYVGTNEVKFDGLAISQPKAADGESREIRIKDIAVSLDSGYENKSVSYQEVIKLAELTVDGKTFGPGEFDIEMKNLDGEALSTFQGQIQNFYREMESFNPDEQMVQLVPMYLQFFTKLIEGSPELNIKRLHLVTPMGEIDGNAQVRFAGGADLTMGDPTALLQSVEAKVALLIHESLVRAIMAEELKKKLAEARDQGAFPAKSDAEIAELVEQELRSRIDAILAQKWLVREGEQLKANASFKSGELLLNGQSLPIFQTQ